MESDSSAHSLLSLFSSSNLTTFTPQTSRNFYKTNSPPPTMSPPPPHDDPSPDRPRKRRKRGANVGEWTCAEIRALDSYRTLLKTDEGINAGLKDVLLPNRTEEEVRLQLARIERTKRDKRRGSSKLEDLVKVEREQFERDEKVRMEEMEEDYKRRRKGLDDILGLEVKREEEEGDFGGDDWRTQLIKVEGQDVQSSLDQVLGLSGESEEQRRKRKLDQALGLL